MSVFDALDKGDLGNESLQDRLGWVGGGMMDVVGQIREGDSRIKLDGYCLFEGKLAKK